MGKYRSQQRLDAGRRRIGSCPCAIEGGKTVVQLAVGCHPRVQGPHVGVRLAHAADNVFHGTRPDGVTAGGEGARAQALGEDLDKRDGIGGRRLVSTPRLLQKANQMVQAVLAEVMR